MPKSKKQNNTEEKKTVWRTPVKLPTISAEDEPMKSLYTSTTEQSSAPQVKAPIADSESRKLIGEHSTEKVNHSTKSSDLIITDSIDKSKKGSQSVSPKRKTETKEQQLSGKPPENDPIKFGEAAFLRLLRSERMDFYSLAEILRGSSMALYCVLYSESLAKGENRCQIRQSELMMRVGINNPATLYKQERWLTVLGLISKSVRSGNHSGASYEVRPLETLPLPNHILDQFTGYLIEAVS